MKRYHTLALAALLALGVSGRADAQSQLDFSLVNRTGYEISEVYVGPTSSNSWGRDILGQDVLPNTRAVDILYWNRQAGTTRAVSE